MKHLIKQFRQYKVSLDQKFNGFLNVGFYLTYFRNRQVKFNKSINELV